MDIDCLPDEIILHIFSFSTIEDLTFVVPKVCKRWRDICGDRKLWRDIVFSVCLEDEDTLLEITEASPNIEILQLTGSNAFTPDFLLTVGQMDRLRTLSLLEVASDVFPIRLEPLAEGCPVLSKLELNVSFCLPNSLEKVLVSKSRQLKSLTLRWDFQSSERFTHLISKCKLKLDVLKLLGCHNVTVDADSAFEDLREQRLLESLKVTGGFRSTPTTADLVSSGLFSHLREVFLSCRESLDDLTVTALWKNCPNLEKAYLFRNTTLSDSAMKYIGSCPKLRVLDVSCCTGLRSKTLAYIALCTTIEELYLRHLDLNRFQPNAYSLLQMYNLKILSLEYSKVASVPFLRFSQNLQKLETLSVEGCYDLELDTIARLQKSFSSLNVLKPF